MVCKSIWISGGRRNSRTRRILNPGVPRRPGTFVKFGEKCKLFCCTGAVAAQHTGNAYYAVGGQHRWQPSAAAAAAAAPAPASSSLDSGGGEEGDFWQDHGAGGGAAGAAE